MKRQKISYTLLFILSILSGSVFMSCHQKELKPVDVKIKNPDRHYYPVNQGEILSVTYEIENPSDEPLVIKEIQTSCGCLIPRDALPIMILPKKTGFIKIGYESIKNSGHVENQIYLYGNFTDSAYRQLNFDTHVVPPSDYSRDYEELYHEKLNRKSALEDFVDGNASEKGYYTDHEGDGRENNRQEIQKKLDSHAF